MKPETTLLVEDNNENRYLARFLLEQAGFEVLVSENGMDALKKAREQSPGSVLLDIQLPDINGYEVARFLKSSPETASIPIIAISSFAMPGEKMLAEKAGCVGYIEKPINPLTFVQDIKGFLTANGGIK